MKNIEGYNLLGVIAMPLEEFETLVDKLTDGLQKVEYEFGAYIVHSDKAEETEEYINEDMTTILSRHFDVEVKSWHSDTNEYPMVFICYEPTPILLAN